jgi:hypothetical protein
MTQVNSIGLSKGFIIKAQIETNIVLNNNPAATITGLALGINRAYIFECSWLGYCKFEISANQFAGMMKNA